MVCGKCPHVIIFANEPPPLKKVSQDRWIIYELVNNNAITWKQTIDIESI